jgi:hypothetical protein
MKFLKNQKGFNDLVTMTIIASILGALFITGIFVWKEIEVSKQNIFVIQQDQEIDKEVRQDDEGEIDDEDYNNQEDWIEFSSIIDGSGYYIKHPRNFWVKSASKDLVNISNYESGTRVLDWGAYMPDDATGIQIQKEPFINFETAEDVIKFYKSEDSLDFEGEWEMAKDVKLGEHIVLSQYTKAGPGGPFMMYIAIDEENTTYYRILVFEPGYSINKELIENMMSTFELHSLD